MTTNNPKKSVADFATPAKMSELFTRIFAGDGTEWQPHGAIQVLRINTPEGDPFVPPVSEGYTFSKTLLRSVLAFLMSPHGDALYLTGPTGSGKTSCITEVLARLNWGCCSLTLTERFEFSTLVGARIPDEQGRFVFKDGPLTLAMRRGYVLVLNEFDLAPPGELSGLNDVLEGRPLVIAETNEVIRPHPLFRVVVTANSKGQGDDTGAYAGVQQQNIAALDRYRILEVGYPTEAIEKGIIAQILRDTLGSEAMRLAAKMVALANEVRSQSVALRGFEGTISRHISTRCLVKWAWLMLDYHMSPNPLKCGLDEALLNGCCESDRAKINQMATVIFGKVWDLPVD